MERSRSPERRTFRQMNLRTLANIRDEDAFNTSTKADAAATAVRLAKEAIAKAADEADVAAIAARFAANRCSAADASAADAEATAVATAKVSAQVAAAATAAKVAADAVALAAQALLRFQTFSGGTLVMRDV